MRLESSCLFVRSGTVRPVFDLETIEYFVSRISTVVAMALTMGMRIIAGMVGMTMRMVTVWGVWND